MRPEPVTQQTLHAAWDLALAERCLHTMGCPHCQEWSGAPAEASVLCPLGRRLAAAEQAAYHQWFQARFQTGEHAL